MNIGVIGLGYWGPNIVRNLLLLGNKVFVYDREPDRVESVMKRFPACVPLVSLGDLLHSSSISAVAIAVPLPSHCDLVVRSLAAGKHVFVEKPLCFSVAEAEAIERHVNGTVLMVAHITQFSKGVDALLHTVNEGKIGTVRRVSCTRTHLGPVYKETDVLTEVAAHDVAILASLFSDPPVSIHAWGISRLAHGSVDAAHLVMTWADARFAEVNVGWSSVLRRREIEIEGTTGTLVYRAQTTPEELLLFEHTEAFALLAGGEQWTSAKEKVVSTVLETSGSEPLQYELSCFLQCIHDHTQPRTDFRFGRRVVMLLEAARRSMHNGGARVTLT
jgi:predicted dehydrogenase